MSIKSDFFLVKHSKRLPALDEIKSNTLLASPLCIIRCSEAMKADYSVLCATLG